MCVSGWRRLTPLLCTVFLSLAALNIVAPTAAAAGETDMGLVSGWVHQDSGVTSNLYGVSAVDDQTAWVVGEDGLILKTTDGGDTWAQQLAGVYSVITSISAVDSNTAWAVGNQLGFEIPILRTTDGGSTWESVFPSAIDPHAYMYLHDIDAVDANTAWVVAFTILTSYPYTAFESVLKTVDAGGTWLVPFSGYNSPTPGVLTSISSLGYWDAWVAGATGRILHSTLFGSFWMPQNSGTTADLADLYSVDGNIAWAVGAGGTIIKTTNGGWNWNLQDSGTTDGLQSISAVDERVAWAVGEDGTVLKSVDGGVHWDQQESSITGITLNAVDVLDPATAWAVGEDGTIIKTVDGGDARPDIVSVSPAAGGEGAEVNVSGCDFGDTQGTSYVSFGSTQATAYTSWSDTEIVAEVPAGAAGDVQVIVTTPEGTSNPAGFTVCLPLTLTSITPDQAVQNAITVQITDLAGRGFMPGAEVRFEQGDTVLDAYDVSVVSDTSITCKIGFFLTPTGAWDVVVVNPGGCEARLEDAFTVTSACGSGSGAALLMLGLTLGLLSLAGSTRLRRKRRRDS